MPAGRTLPLVCLPTVCGRPMEPSSVLDLHTSVPSAPDSQFKLDYFDGPPSKVEIGLHQGKVLLKRSKFGQNIVRLSRDSIYEICVVLRRFLHWRQYACTLTWTDLRQDGVNQNPYSACLKVYNLACPTGYATGTDRLLHIDIASCLRSSFGPLPIM